jgi:hypothetical protein
MGDVSDIAELLPKARHDIARKRIVGVVKAVMALAAIYAAAGRVTEDWIANKFAKKDDVAQLIRGQDDKIGQCQAAIQALSERQARTETRVEDIRGTMVIRR